MRIRRLLVILLISFFICGCSKNNNKLTASKHIGSDSGIEEKKLINNNIDYSLFNKLKINIVDDYGAVANDSKDDWKAIQDALNQVEREGGGTIVIPNGEYIVTHSLRIYKNTRLKLMGGTSIIRKHSGTMLINGAINGNYQGYNGQGNIVVEGGTYIMNLSKNDAASGSWFGIGRADGIAVRNTKVMDIANSHGIDLNSSRNVMIENVKFLGFRDTTEGKSKSYIEAIQIANHTKKGFSAFGDFDGTPSKSVTIKNCLFDESGTKGFGTWGVGIGNHGFGILNLYNEKIKIQNNTFKEMSMAGIHMTAYKNVIIQENDFIENKNAIIMNTPKNNYNQDTSLSNHLQAGENIKINSNIFKNTYKENILLVGDQNEQETATINKVNIISNKFIGRESNIPRDYININLHLCKYVLIKDNYTEKLSNTVVAKQSKEVKIENDISSYVVKED